MEDENEDTMSAPPSPQLDVAERDSLWQALHQRNGTNKSNYMPIFINQIYIFLY